MNWETVKIYQVCDVDWVATDQTKQETYDWYVCDYPMGGEDCVDPIEHWKEVGLETIHLRDISGYEEGECTMRETIEKYLESKGTLPFVVSTTEW